MNKTRSIEVRKHNGSHGIGAWHPLSRVNLPFDDISAIADQIMEDQDGGVAGEWIWRYEQPRGADVTKIEVRP